MTARAIEPVIHEVCRYIEAHLDEPLTLDTLATVSGYSPAHLQREFVALMGSSPRAYQKALRLKRLKDGLRAGLPPLPAMLEAGFGSPSRAYGDLERTLGMTPGQYRDGAPELKIGWASVGTPLGLMVLGATDRGICFLQFGDSERTLVKVLECEFPRAEIVCMPQSSRLQFALWERAIDDFFERQGTLEKLPLDLKGTAFQVSVWKFLQTIPPGVTASYADVAAALGRPRAVRAVAAACARNRVALLVPCHRVIRGDGALAGYRWGLDRKQKLLDWEANEVHMLR